MPISCMQAPPVPIGADLGAFRAEVAAEAAAGARLVVYPELHLFGADAAPDGERNALLRASAVDLADPLIATLGTVARDASCWLVPGSICERGGNGELFNTAVVFDPQGALVATYRKVFPWRPYEPYDPGDRFTVFDIPGTGRFGLSICYDAWFPEVTRHLAWMGAEAVLNIVKTTTPDRAQEVVLARANAIVNQNVTISVNCAGPVGRGQSLIVDAEGAVLASSDDAAPCVLRHDLDLDAVARTREHGTAGSNRMWEQFLPTDRPLALPLYEGRIDPARWRPRHPAADSATRP